MSDTRIGVVIHTPLLDRLLGPEDRRRLNALGEVKWADSDERLSVEEAAAMLADCEVGIGSWGTPHPCVGLMQACPKLRLWEHVGGTVKHMFGPHLSGRDLTIASCKPAIADNVAEMVLGLILLGLRGAFPNAAANRCRRTGEPASSRVASGATIGVVGASHVGRRVIGLLRAWSCRVLLYDPYVSEEQARELDVELVPDLMELCASSDVVTLHAPALSSTEKMIGSRELKAMRDDTVFINTSRGICVDEAALIAELELGRLFAFLDVTDPEPAADDSPLRRLPNVVLTSHIAGGRAWNLGAQAVDDVAAFLRGESPACVGRPDEFDRIA